MDIKEERSQRFATWIKNSQKIKPKKETKILDKHKVDTVTPTFTATDLSKILDVPVESVTSAVNALVDVGYEIKRNGNHSRSSYVLTHEVCVMIAKELGIQTLADRKANGEVIPCVVTTSHQGKGGVGKSTTVNTMACQSHFDFKHQPRTLLIDGDPQGTLRHLSSEEMKATEATITTIMTSAFQLTREERLTSEKQAEYRAALDKLMIRHQLNSIRILPSQAMDKYFSLNFCSEFTKVDSIDAAKVKIMTVFKDCIISPLEDLFDQIIVDTNPDTNLTTLMYLYATTHLVVPVTGRNTDIDAFKDFFKVLEMLGDNLMPDDGGLFEMRPIITMNRKQPKTIDDNATKILKAMGDAFQTKIAYSLAYEVASEKGVPIHLLERKSSVTAALPLLEEVYNEYKLWVDWD